MNALFQMQCMAKVIKYGFSNNIIYEIGVQRLK